MAWEAPSPAPSRAAGLWRGQFLSNPRMHGSTTQAATLCPGSGRKSIWPWALPLWVWNRTRWVL